MAESQKSAIPGLQCMCTEFKHDDLQVAQEAFRQRVTDFIQRCEAKDLTPYLFADSILSKTELEEIDGCSIKRDRGMKLVHALLECKRSDWFDKLLQALSNEPAYEDIMKELHLGYVNVKETSPEELSSSSSTDTKKVLSFWPKTETGTAKRIATIKNASRIREKRCSDTAVVKKTIVLAGVTGSGKSTLGNFLTNKNTFDVEDAFANSKSVTERACSCEFYYGKYILNMIDMPGLDSESSTKEYFDNFARTFMEAKDGIDAILLCCRCSERFGELEEAFTEFLEAIGRNCCIWDHCILMLTEGYKAGKIESERKKMLFQQIEKGKVHPTLVSWLEKVQNRCIIVESVIDISEKYRCQKLNDLLGLVGKMCVRSSAEESYTPLNLDILRLAREISSHEISSSETTQSSSVEMLANILQSIGIELSASKREMRADLLQQRIKDLLLKKDREFKRIDDEKKQITTQLKMMELNSDAKEREYQALVKINQHLQDEKRAQVKELEETNEHFKSLINEKVELNLQLADQQPKVKEICQTKTKRNSCTLI